MVGCISSSFEVRIFLNVLAWNFQTSHGAADTHISVGVRPTSPLNLFEALHRKAEACRGSCQPHRLDLTSQLCCSQHCMGSWRKGPLQRTQLWSTQKAWNSPEAFHSDFSTSSYRAQNWPLAVRKGKIFISDDLLLWQCHEGFHSQTTPGDICSFGSQACLILRLYNASENNIHSYAS